MDTLSKPLEDFLIRLATSPDTVSGRMRHYTEHLLHLLNVRDEMLIMDYYGLFGHEVKNLDQLAAANNTTPDIIAQALEVLLHKLAITPEWQMMNQINHQK